MNDLRELEGSVKNATNFFNSMNYKKCLEEIETALKIAHAYDHSRMMEAECSVWLCEYIDLLRIEASLGLINDSKVRRGMMSYTQNNILDASQYSDCCTENDPGHMNTKQFFSNLKSFKKQMCDANDLMERGKFNDALNIFTEAKVVNFKNNTNPVESIASYTRATDLKPDEASRYAERVECHLMPETSGSTMNDTRKSTVFDKSIIDEYIWRAKCLITLGKYFTHKICN